MTNRVFLIGYMASGKTTIGKLLAARLGYVFLDTDRCIEAKKLKTVAEIFSEEGEVCFRKLEQKCLHELAEFENVVISTGGGTPCFFDNMQYMNEFGATVYLKWSAKDLSERLMLDKTNRRPLIARLKENELEAFVATGLTEREPTYSQANLTVSGTEEEILEQIYRWHKKTI